MAKKALLVGINDYRGPNDLNGCVNDVTNMRDVLRNYMGYKNNQIRVITDSRATKSAILTMAELACFWRHGWGLSRIPLFRPWLSDPGPQRRRAGRRHG